MSKLNKKVIENIKTSILVVLSLSTILLLYFFWWDVSLEDLKFPDDRPVAEVPGIRAVTQPEKVIACFGGESYCIAPWKGNGLWDNNNEKEKSIVKEFQKFGQAENILVEEISKEQYSEVLSGRYRYIQAQFAYSIPFKDFCTQFKIKKTQAYETIEKLSSVAYSEGSKESLFIRDGANGKYYRLVSDTDHTDFTSLIATMESSGYAPYYPLSTVFGPKNDTLIPLIFTSDLTEFTVNQELYTDQEERIIRTAQSFFGESLDFTRRITEENGTVIYMYGYGEKTLIVTPEGTLEFKESLKEENYVSQSYFEALETAVQFIGSHGTWDALEVMQPYVKSVEAASGKKKGYRFTFGMKINGEKVFYKTGEVITIEVTGGQVTFYQRNMIDLKTEDIPTNGVQKEASASDMITDNYEYIYNVLMQEEAKAASQKEGASDAAISVAKVTLGEGNTFDAVVKRITNIQTGYLRAKNKNTESISYTMKPVWVVSAGNIDLYFGLYDAKPVPLSESGIAQDYGEGS